MQINRALHRFALAALLCTAVPFPLSVAQSAIVEETVAARLDRLFAELKAARDAEAAEIIAQEIWSAWLHPEDPDLDALMQRVILLRGIGQISSGLELLDQIVVDYPDYAEAWNQRATLHYMVSDYDASLADIERTLELEPRHFGALSGRVLIHLARGEREAALRDMSAALAIHPFLSERALFPELDQETVNI
jgi:tetratricopeptide (TPR) repeat protein